MLAIDQFPREWSCLNDLHTACATLSLQDGDIVCADEQVACNKYLVAFRLTFGMCQVCRALEKASSEDEAAAISFFAKLQGGQLAVRELSREQLRKFFSEQLQIELDWNQYDSICQKISAQSTFVAAPLLHSVTFTSPLQRLCDYRRSQQLVMAFATLVCEGLRLERRASHALSVSLSHRATDADTDTDVVSVILRMVGDEAETVPSFRKCLLSMRAGGTSATREIRSAEFLRDLLRTLTRRPVEDLRLLLSETKGALLKETRPKDRSRRPRATAQPSLKVLTPEVAQLLVDRHETLCEALSKYWDLSCGSNELAETVIQRLVHLLKAFMTLRLRALRAYREALRPATDTQSDRQSRGREDCLSAWQRDGRWTRRQLRDAIWDVEDALQALFHVTPKRRTHGASRRRDARGTGAGHATQRQRESDNADALIAGLRRSRSADGTTRARGSGSVSDRDRDRDSGRNGYGQESHRLPQTQSQRSGRESRPRTAGTRPVDSVAEGVERGGSSLSVSVSEGESDDSSLSDDDTRDEVSRLAETAAWSHEELDLLKQLGTVIPLCDSEASPNGASGCRTPVGGSPVLQLQLDLEWDWQQVVRRVADARQSQSVSTSAPVPLEALAKGQTAVSGATAEVLLAIQQDLRQDLGADPGDRLDPLSDSRAVSASLSASSRRHAATLRDADGLSISASQQHLMRELDHTQLQQRVDLLVAYLEQLNAKALRRRDTLTQLLTLWKLTKVKFSDRQALPWIPQTPEERDLDRLTRSDVQKQVSALQDRVLAEIQDKPSTKLLQLGDKVAAIRSGLETGELPDHESVLSHILGDVAALEDHVLQASEDALRLSQKILHALRPDPRVSGRRQ